MKVRIYRKDKHVVLPPKWEIHERKMKNPLFDPRWQIMDYDKYIKHIHLFTDACGPIDDPKYVTKKKKQWKKKSDPKYIKRIEKKKVRKTKEKVIKLKQEAQANIEEKWLAEYKVEEKKHEKIKKKQQIRTEQRINYEVRKAKEVEVVYPVKSVHKPSTGHMDKLKKSNVPYDITNKFYESSEWKFVRDKFLSQQPKPFQCYQCGSVPDPNYVPKKRNSARSESEKLDLEYEWNKNRIVVDHKLPVKYFWDLRLDLDNFQLLCGCCNKEKLNYIYPEFLREATIRAQEKDKKENSIMGVYK